jgi:hypothetical protein
MTNHDEPSDTRRVPIPAETLLMEAVPQRQLLFIDGYMPLPVGTSIELMDPRSDAEVTGVRLWGADSGRSTLVLDVMLIAPGDLTDRP